MVFDSVSKLEKKYSGIMYGIFTLYMVTILLNSTVLYYSGGPFVAINKAVRYLCYIYFIGKVLIDWYYGAGLSIAAVGVGVCAVLVALIGHNTEPFFLFLVIYGLRRAELKKLVKFAAVASAVIFVLCVVLSIAGVIPDWTYLRKDGTVRHSLGFFYPAHASGVYLSIVLMYAYLRFSSFRYFELIIAEGLNIGLFFLTDSRLAFYLITIVLIALIAVRVIRRLSSVRSFLQRPVCSRVIGIVLTCLPVLMLAMTFLFVFLYRSKNGASVFLDRLLSGRFKYADMALQNYSIKLFGSAVEWIGWGGYGYITSGNVTYNFVDISYLKMLYDYGIVLSAVILAAYTARIYCACKKREYDLLFAMLWVLVWLFVEPYIISIGKNIFILAFIPLLDAGRIKFFDSLMLRINRKITSIAERSITK